MKYTFELNEEDTKFAEAYAAQVKKTVSEIARDFLLEGIEDVMDVRAAVKALAEYEADPVTYTHAEIGKMLELA